MFTKDEEVLLKKIDQEMDQQTKKIDKYMKSDEFKETLRRMDKELEEAFKKKT